MSVLLAPALSRGAILFTVDTFTADELTLTIEASTLSGSSTPSELSESLTLFGEDVLLTGWVLPENAENTSVTGSLGDSALSSIAAAHGIDSLLGDTVELKFDGPIAAGDSTAGFTVTITGTDLFDTSAITNFYLYWGDGSDSSSILQSTSLAQSGATSSAVPEPSTYSLVFGALALLFTGIRRRAVR